MITSASSAQKTVNSGTVAAVILWRPQEYGGGPDLVAVFEVDGVVEEVEWGNFVLNTLVGYKT